MYLIILCIINTVLTDVFILTISHLINQGESLLQSQKTHFDLLFLYFRNVLKRRFDFVISVTLKGKIYRSKQKIVLASFKETKFFFFYWKAGNREVKIYLLKYPFSFPPPQKKKEFEFLSVNLPFFCAFTWLLLSICSNWTPLVCTNKT